MQEVLEERVRAAGLDGQRTLDWAGDRGAARPCRRGGAPRVRRYRREAVRIVPFRTELREHFYRINAEWVERYFTMEPADIAVLTNPEEKVLKGGGAVLFAMLGDEVVGTCALKQEYAGRVRADQDGRFALRHRGSGSAG